MPVKRNFRFKLRRLMIIVTASVRKIEFETLDSYFGLRLWTQALRTSGFGLGTRILVSKQRP